MRDNNKHGKAGFFIVILIIASLTIGSFSVSTKNIDSDPYIDDTNDTEYWALIVGVGIYADDPDQNRPLMLREIRDFQDTLLSSSWWQEDHIKFIEGEDATCVNIVDGLKWLDEKEDENDISVIYLTTHGFPLGYDIPPFDEADGTDEALVSFWGFAYKSLYFWDDELNYLLNQLESEGVCLIVDSCFAGGFNDPPDWNQKILGYRNEKTSDETLAYKSWAEGIIEDVGSQGRVVLMASREDEVSYSGGFSPYLVDGLRGYADYNDDGIVTAEEAFEYVEPRTYRQHPTIYDGFIGDLPLVNYNTITQKEVETKEITKDFISQKSVFAKSVVCGYVKDNESNKPIENVLVEIIEDGHWYDDAISLYTDSNGFYTCEVEAGKLHVLASARKYYSTFLFDNEVEENEVCWLNISLLKAPDDDCKLMGFVTDEETQDTIKDAYITIRSGNWHNQFWNQTETNSEGYYCIDLVSGYSDLIFEAQDYITWDIDNYEILPGEIKWYNVTLRASPLVNSRISGFLTDSLTGLPVDSATIEVEWSDDNHNQIYYQTSSDENGFYSVQLPAGETYIYISARNYNYETTFRYDTQENETLWVNRTLNPSIIEVDFTQPLNAIYVFSNRLIPYPKSIVIGKIDVQPLIHDFWYRERDDVSKIEFYVDNELRDTVTEEPFVWVWDDKTFGEHTLKIVAHDLDGNIVEVERNVLKIF